MRTKNLDLVGTAEGDNVHRRDSQFMPTYMDCREDLHRFLFVFEQAQCLCDGFNNHIIQLAEPTVIILTLELRSCFGVHSDPPMKNNKMSMVLLSSICSYIDSLIVLLAAKS